jgi:hypothetical protein
MCWTPLYAKQTQHNMCWTPLYAKQTGIT